MKYIKSILEATYHVFLFKRYTTMPRTLEIGYGIVAWICLLELVYIGVKHLIL